MRTLKNILYTLLILFAIFIGSVIFLLATPPGMQAMVKMVNWATPAQISIKQPRGSLFHHLSFKELTYKEDAVIVTLKGGQLSWRFWALWNQQLLIKSIQFNDVQVEIFDTHEAIKDTAQTDFSLPQLPLTIQIHQVVVDNLRIKQAGSVYALNQLKLEASLNNRVWRIQQSGLNYNDFQFLLDAQIEPHPPYHATSRLQFSSISEPKTGMRGALHLSGTQALYHLQGELKGPLQGEINGVLKNGEQLSMTANWHDSHYPAKDTATLSSPKGHLSIEGTLNDLLIEAQTKLDKPLTADWQLKATVQNEQVNLLTTLTTPEGRIHGSFHYDAQAKNAFHGSLESRGLNLNELNLPISHVQFNSHFSGNSLATATGEVHLSADYMGQMARAELHYARNQLKADVTLEKNHLHITGRPPFSWQGKVVLPTPHLLHPSLKGLQTTIKADFDIKSPQNGELLLTILPGSYQPPSEQSLPPIHFKGGHVTTKLTTKGLNSQGALTIDRNKQFTVQFALPDFRLDKSSLASQAIQGSFKLDLNSLDFLNGISPSIEQVNGRLKVNLNASGMLTKPTLTGQLKLNGASVHLPQQDLTLNPIEANLTTEGGKWALRARAVADNDELHLTGEGALTPQISGAFNVKAAQFPAMKTAEYTVYLAPDLTIQFQSNDWTVTGTILVPKAELKPISFSNTINLTEDAVFVSDKQDEATPLNLTVDVEVKMGDNVALDVKGLKGFLAGGIRYQQRPKGEPFAVGDLRIRDGKYQAYGQDLIIQEGQLIFAGNRLSNPGIRLRAVRLFNNASNDFSGSNQWFDFTSGNLDTFDLSGKVVVGVELKGRVDDPKIKLFSIPGGLSDADILSMILLGKPASQASKSGGQLLLTALTSMDLDSGTKGVQLVNQLKQNLGVDFNLQSTSTYDQSANAVNDSTAFVIGKSITKRLYMSYNIGLFQQDSNVLTLKYLLNRYFSIQVTASDIGSGLDLLYNHTKD